MPARFFHGLMTAGVGFALAGPVLADPPTFGELLTRAEAQAASGHRWGPPGDNMTETVAGMMGLISSATPQQLSELSALLESDATQLSEASKAQATEQPDATPAAPLAITAPSPSAPAELDRADVGKPDVAKLDVGKPDVAKLDVAKPDVAKPDVAKPEGAIAPPLATAVEPDRAVTEPAAPMPALPALPAAVSAGHEVKSTVKVTPPAVTATPERDRPVVKPAAPVAPPAAATVAHADARAAEMFARGQEAERLGDVSGARRFYAVAMARGSPVAARNLGRLYDPAYLKRTALGGIDPDPALARHWYERAVAMGDPVAGPLLEALALR